MIGDPPLLLAFDTSTPIGSVALARGPEVLARRFLPPGEHSRQLVPAIAEAMEEAGASRKEIAGIVVGRGPGSFTGVRIASATARGLARGLGVPLWPRSSLAAAAASVEAALPGWVRDAVEAMAGTASGPFVAGRPLYVLFDARGDRVYAACYRTAPGGMETLVEPSASTIPEVLASELPTGVVFCGTGALRHRSAIEAAGLAVLPPPAGVPTAEGLLRLHALGPDDPPEPGGSRWEPDYVRGSSAKRPAEAGSPR